MKKIPACKIGFLRKVTVRSDVISSGTLRQGGNLNLRKETSKSACYEQYLKLSGNTTLKKKTS